MVRLDESIFTIPAVLARPLGADLVSADGYKLIGSAQLQRGKTILQHGSIRLEPDTQLFTQVFGEAVRSPVNLPCESGEMC
jgi:lipoate-protein ligase A